MNAHPPPLAAAQRVLILGSPGAGKSTLARRLGPLLRLPVIHLDRRYWRPGWVETPEAAWRAEVAALVAGEAWIIDGNYSSTFDLRFPRADAIIHLDFPRRLAFYRAIKRSVLKRPRPDLAPGCPEKIDLEFYRFVWRFRRDCRPKTLEALSRWGDDKRVYTFERPAALKAFLAAQ